MEYRQLGNTDIKVSVICLGSMTWGEQNSEADGHAQLDYALDRGVNFIDTAEIYAVPPREETYGETERIIGTWLASRRNRDKVVLATKVAPRNERFPYVRDGIERTRLDASNIRRAVDASLQRLQTDYIDLYQLHWPERQANFFGRLGYPGPGEDDGTPFEETLVALQEQVDAGKIRHVGLSNETAWGVMAWLRLHERKGLPRMQAVQNPYNFLNRTYEVGLAEVSCREQCGLLAYSPLGMGALSGKYLDGAKPAGARLTVFGHILTRYGSDRALAAAAKYVRLAQEHGLDPAQMALAFVNSRAFLTANIIGATTLEQLKANIDSVDLDLSEEVLAGIEEIHKEDPNPCP